MARTEGKIEQSIYDSIDQSLFATYKRNQPEKINQEDFKNISERANVPFDYVVRRFDAISRRGDIDPLLKDTKRKGDRGGRSAMLVGGQAKLDKNNSISIGSKFKRGDSQYNSIGISYKVNF